MTAITRLKSISDIGLLYASNEFEKERYTELRELAFQMLNTIIDHPIDINIYLKNHQLAMVKKCIDIEETNLCGYGIMNDKPGSGKSYTILAFFV